MAIVWAEVVERARHIAAEYETAVTLRQLHYRACSEGLIPNQPWAYRKLSSHLAASRRAGRGPDLVDPTREIHVPAAWADAGELLAEVPERFRLDRTAGQAAALYVCAEKNTLQALFSSWLGGLGIPVVIVRGFASEPYVQLVRERTAADPRSAILIYCGDWDCSGSDVERDWLARTEGCWDHVARLLLTREQVEAYRLPATEGKRGDPRWPAWARQHGYDVEHPVQWEVEGLDPEELRRLVLGAVAEYIDMRALEAVLAEERRQRAALQAFVDSWQNPSQ